MLCFQINLVNTIRALSNKLDRSLRLFEASNIYLYDLILLIRLKKFCSFSFVAQGNVTLIISVGNRAGLIALSASQL